MHPSLPLLKSACSCRVLYCSLGSVLELKHSARSSASENWGNSLRFKDIDFHRFVIMQSHQLPQLLAAYIPIRLRWVEFAFSAAEGFKFGGGFELPSAADEDSVGGGCALKLVEEGFLFHAGLSQSFLAEGVRLA